MTSTVSEGIRGNAGMFLTFALNGDEPGPATPFDGDIKAFTVEGADADDSDLTFLEASTGGAQVDTINVTAIQSLATGSFWRYLWDNAGAEVSIVYGPAGNAVASADKPHFLITAKLGNRPNIGGEAARGSASAKAPRFDFDSTLEVLDIALDDGTP